MYAQISQADVDTKGPLFIVNNVYEIKNFLIKNARTNYMPFDAKLMIEISCYTEVKTPSKVPSTFPVHIYHTMSFSQIDALQDSTKKYIGKYMSL